MSQVTTNERVRQVATTLSAAAMLVGTLFGVGVLGDRVAESSGGSLSATATLLAPASTAFSIWSVIYLGLAAYVVWQWVPRTAASTRGRSIGWLAALSMLLNGGWLLVTQAGWLWGSVLVIVVLALTLGLIMERLTSLRPEGGTGERIVVDGTFGLYLGWVTVATVANIAATLADSGMEPAPGTAELLAVVVLAAAAAIGAFLAFRLGGRVGVAVAMAWGLGWIAVGRAATEPESTVTAVAAAAAAVLVVAATVAARARKTRAHTPAA